MRALLVSTYDLGHQPFGLASPAAWLRRDGIDVSCVDLAKERLDDERIREADLVAFHLPMHTATRLVAPVIGRVRRLNPSARVCTYGLYSPLNGDWLRSIGVDDVLGGEFEAELARIANSVPIGVRHPSDPGGKNRPNGGQILSGAGEMSVDATLKGASSARSVPTGVRHLSDPGVQKLPRLQFLVPDRTGLPALNRYATLTLADGSQRTAGYTEASRGCRHVCRHCPVVPVYNGQFRVVPPDIVLDDVSAQVEAGAAHITFGDPDFFNGPTHALRVVLGLHARHPSLTYDVTIKIEHLLRHRELLPRLRETGCLFVTSAVESLDDRVLEILDKGHTRADFVDAVSLCETTGLTLVPTFVAFHPWQTLDLYREFVDTIADLDLIDHVAPIQLTIRLLVPQGSRLLERDEMRVHLGPFDPGTLAFPWSHPDPRVDELHRDLVAIVGGRLTADRRAVFAEISALAHEMAGVPARASASSGSRRPVPFFNEPWYCCAEPNPEQLRVI